MVFVDAPWGRWLLLALVATLGLSSGVASVATGGLEGIAGHTAFVRGVYFRDVPEAPQLPPLEYGLATYRDIKFFGLWTIDRPVRESQDRMVFVWSADAPDPRGEATLVPTDDYARLRDRNGLQWTVYEFTYLQDGMLHHAYGVRVGATHESDDQTLGQGGAYNYVLTYRPERLLQPSQAAVPDGAPSAAGAVGPLGGAMPAAAGAVADGATAAPPSTEAGEGTSGPPRVVFGTGAVPAALDAADPAPERSALPAPPGIPSLGDR